jgi:alkylation response protein AidB-like acyl-CoA dehydrogenase
MGESGLQAVDTGHPRGRATEAFPQDRRAKRELLLARVDAIGPILQESGGKSEELGTLAPEAVAALRGAGMFQLKLPAVVGGAEADPVTEMLVLERIAYYDFTSAWCTMVGATGVAALGIFLPQAALDQVFANGQIPTASISFFPAGRAVREPGGYRLSGRWRFNSGIHHSEWVLGGAVVEGTEQENGGRPLVIFAAMPAKEVTLYDNWRDVVGLRGTGSCDCSVENYFLPEQFTFVWDLLKPQPRRGGISYLLPPYSFVAKEHGSVAVGAARRALDELIKLATTTRGAFRSSKLDERQIVHRQIAEADLKIRAARALMHERYEELYQKVQAGALPDGPDIADTRAICLHATDVAIGIVTMAYHFSGNTGLRHPHVLGRLLRDINTAGIHQVMSDTAYENHGKFRLGLPADPLA